MDGAGQIKLLGFAGPRDVPDPSVLCKAIAAELVEMKEVLGDRMTVICGTAAGADLVFLRACVELRIPAIVFLPYPEGESAHEEERVMARHLTGVALAKYVVPSGGYEDVSRHLLDWADVFLFVSEHPHAGGIMQEARDLGIPSRILDGESLSAEWGIEPDMHRKARHGFDNRADLLDFLDARFAQG